MVATRTWSVLAQVEEAMKGVSPGGYSVEMELREALMAGAVHIGHLLSVN
jgi:hypothetical protein